MGLQLEIKFILITLFLFLTAIAANGAAPFHGVIEYGCGPGDGRTITVEIQELEMTVDLVAKDVDIFEQGKSVTLTVNRSSPKGANQTKGRNRIDLEITMNPKTESGFVLVNAVKHLFRWKSNKRPMCG